MVTQFSLSQTPTEADTSGFGTTIMAGGAGAEIGSAGLGAGSLKNESGNFVLPMKEAVETATGLGTRTPPARNTYPILNYESAIVSANQADTATAVAILNFCFNRLSHVKRRRVISIVGARPPCRLLSEG
jgi:hypothetical protein